MSAKASRRLCRRNCRSINISVPDPKLSIIVPALNEAANLPSLAERIHATVQPTPYELLIIDDNSHDNTREVCAELANQYPLRLIVREQPTNGLSGAVLHGIGESRGRRIVVMDAD